MTRILLEHGAHLKEQIQNYLSGVKPEDWSTISLVKTALREYALGTDIDQDRKFFGECYGSVLQEYTKSNDPHTSQTALERLEALTQIMDAEAVKNIFLQKHLEIIRENGVLVATSSLIRQSTETLANSSSDQDKKLFKDMTITEKTAFLIDKIGEAGVLDLTKHQIPRRYLKTLDDMRGTFSLRLTPMVTLPERRVLLAFAQCDTASDVSDLLANLFAQRDVSPNVGYLRSAIDALQSLWSSDRMSSLSHNEGWFRQNVYAHVWDRLFLHNDMFYTKRAECLSALIRELQETGPDIAQQRLDFILRSINDRSDYLSSEEKPENKEIAADMKKGKLLQRHILDLWYKKLGSARLVCQLEAITCQWHGCKLIIYGTRMIEKDHFLTYKKRVITLPSKDGHNATAAQVLATLLSLKQLITLNYARFGAMLEEKQRAELETLKTPDDCEFLVRDNSFEEDLDEVETSIRMDKELENRILRKCNSIQQPADVVTEKDWELILVDDVNSKRSGVATMKRRRKDRAL